MPAKQQPQSWVGLSCSPLENELRCRSYAPPALYQHSELVCGEDDLGWRVSFQLLWSAAISTPDAQLQSLLGLLIAAEGQRHNL